jgi:NADH-quinone oxidoreductase subunit H
MTFAQFFLGENINIIFMCSFMTLLFFGGWLPIINISVLYLIPGIIWFVIKILIFLFSFVWVRVSFPRYRYDQLMRLGWKIFLPLALAWVVFVSTVLLSFDILI